MYAFGKNVYNTCMLCTKHTILVHFLFCKYYHMCFVKKPELRG